MQIVRPLIICKVYLELNWIETAFYQALKTEVWFTDQNSKPLEIEDIVNMAPIIW